jgi:GT2 family glycosyltransferase
MLYSRHGTAVSLSSSSSATAPDESSACRAIAESLARREVEATVEPDSTPGRWRVRYALHDQPEVTLVVPTGGKLRFLRPGLESLSRQTTYPNIQFLVIDNSSGDEVAALCAELAATGVAIQREPLPLQPFNFSALINHAIRMVDSPYLVLLNDDMTVITPDWIEAMLEHAQQPGVGAVGCKLLYPDDTIQHAGVVFGPHEGAVHPFRHFPDTHPGYFGIHQVVRNVSAVTFACAMLRRSIFDEVGLLDEVDFRVAFNDADFCLRILDRGYRIVYTPHAVLRHYESATKKTIADPGEVAALRERWSAFIRHDPFYNPNLTRAGENYGLDLR